LNVAWAHKYYWKHYIFSLKGLKKIKKKVVQSESYDFLSNTEK